MQLRADFEIFVLKLKRNQPRRNRPMQMTKEKMFLEKWVCKNYYYYLLATVNYDWVLESVAFIINIIKKSF